ncbi:MAG: hypothetical protein PHH54_06285 [Candidatus Nanoarchaeia archaeon]|nr:hypothetical protein [Candidatus Nanoarchaeia archaeon]
MSKSNVLIIEGSVAEANAMRKFFSDSVSKLGDYFRGLYQLPKDSDDFGFNLTTAVGIKKICKSLEGSEPAYDIIIIGDSHIDQKTILKSLNRLNYKPIIIVITSDYSMSSICEIMRLGAWTCVPVHSLDLVFKKTLLALEEKERQAKQNELNREGNEFVADNYRTKLYPKYKDNFIACEKKKGKWKVVAASPSYLGLLIKLGKDWEERELHFCFIKS